MPIATPPSPLALPHASPGKACCNSGVRCPPWARQTSGPHLWLPGSGLLPCVSCESAVHGLGVGLLPPWRHIPVHFLPHCSRLPPLPVLAFFVSVPSPLSFITEFSSLSSPPSRSPLPLIALSLSLFYDCSLCLPPSQPPLSSPLPFSSQQVVGSLLPGDLLPPAGGQAAGRWVLWAPRGRPPIL